jgi:site-specific recombinase XerD
MPQGKQVDRAEIEVWTFTPHVAFEDALGTAHISNEGCPYSMQSRVQFVAMFNTFCRYMLERQISILQIDGIEIAQFLELRGLCIIVSGKPKSKTPVVAPVPSQTSLCGRYLSLLGNVMAYLVSRGLRMDNPIDPESFRRIGCQRCPPQTRRCLSPEQDITVQQFLLSRVPAERVEVRRDLAMLLFMLGAGPRVSEVRNARVVDFDVSDSGLTFRVRRTDGCFRIVPLDHFCVQPVQQWLEEARSLEFGESPPLAFANPRGYPQSAVSIFLIVRKMLASINLDNLRASPSILRNTWCQRRILDGIDLRLLQQQMGVNTSRSIDEIRQTIGATR